MVVSKRTRTIVRWILIPCGIATAIGMVLLWPAKPHLGTPADPTQRAYGNVTKITEVPCPPPTDDTSGAPQGPAMPCGTAIVKVTAGPSSGKDVTVQLPQGAGAPRLSVGDQVVLEYQPDVSGTGTGTFDVIDKQRGRQLLFMTAICALVVVAFGRLRGFASLVGLALSFAVLLLFIIPAILDGASPLPVAIVGSSAIMFAVLYLTNGISVETSVAVLGTLASLVLTGILGALFTVAASLTGFGDETTFSVTFLSANVDLRGLLLAGVIIGGLGVLNDVTITQAATVAELSRGTMSRAELYRSATRIGRAHVASAVPTIILAYAGTSLPLLLIIAAGGLNVSDVLTSQIFGQEIVRAIVGTIGLVASVPITTALGVLVADIRGHSRGQSSGSAEARPEPRADGRAAARPDHRPEPDHWAEVLPGR
jgi:uncharacterized membrane protein